MAKRAQNSAVSQGERRLAAERTGAWLACGRGVRGSRAFALVGMRG